MNGRSLSVPLFHKELEGSGETNVVGSPEETDRGWCHCEQVI